MCKRRCEYKEFALQVDLVEQLSLSGQLLVVRGHSGREYSRGSSGASRG